MCLEFKISMPSAYRHIAKGTTPNKERRLGRDGKFYPVRGSSRPRPPKLAPAEHQLLIAMHALMEAGRFPEFSEKEKRLLIAVQAQAIGLTTKGKA
jgi:hypothetical protein